MAALVESAIIFHLQTRAGFIRGEGVIFDGC